MSVDWFRWWHGSVTDPKFGAVSLKAKCSLPDVLAVWVALLEHASQSTDRGSVEDCPADEIAWCLRIGCDTVADILAGLESRGMIKNGRIDAWERRQPAREDAVAEGSKPSSQRVREFRERKRNEQGPDSNADETRCNADATRCNADETHQRRVDTEKSRGESQHPSGDVAQIDTPTAEIPVAAEPPLADCAIAEDEVVVQDGVLLDATKPARRVPTTQEQVHCRETWCAYSEAYRERYGVDPLRNAKVNAAIKGFVRRVGGVEAPGVARFYLTHPDAFYSRKCHDVALLLADAEKLRTEWVTQRQVTGITARQQERTGTMRAAVDRIIAKREAATG